VAITVIGTLVTPGALPAFAVISAETCPPAGTVTVPLAGLTVTPDPAGGAARHEALIGAPAVLLIWSVACAEPSACR
jgi:hypothetical protein